ncbi:MAG: TonB-dependent receptor [Spongiibacteraceae bacterium]
MMHGGLVRAELQLERQLASHASMEEVKVWGEQKNSRQAGYTNPISIITPEDLKSINVVTTEDIVKYEPSLVIRRRFIGDANGTLGIRGSNMFQTSRSMVFADGVPLHYFLQSRWSGAPRWTMVSASEIAQVEVVYGPFSAEYSGNAMGGVVVIETAIPQQRELHIDGTFFSQTFDEYGFDDKVNGFKGFISAGDKIGDLSLYASYNHLDSESQPQTFYYGASSSSTSPTAVTGAIAGNDERSNPRLYFGDTGVVDTTTDNYKIKAAYDFGDWFALLNVAYEDRSGESSQPNAYVRDVAGHAIWSGDVVQNGEAFSIPSSRLSVSDMERQSLSVGFRLKGQLAENIALETSLNQFEVLKDQTRTSLSNPNDPAYTEDGQVTDYGDTGWQTADMKLTVDDFFARNLTMITGLRYEAYELNTNVYDSNNYTAGSKDSLTSSSGGETSLLAAFVQMNWAVGEQWDVSLGGRYEAWKSKSGYFSADNVATPELDLEFVPSRAEEKFSPKFSLGYQPNNDWLIRYSLAKAYRFPIVEELFSQYQAYNAISEANPELAPEDGLHHNLMFERSLEQGYMRVNIFKETIKNVIDSQFTTLPSGGSLYTFVPVDEVETQGVEFIINQGGFLLPLLDVRINLVYTDAEIIKNVVDTSIEGNEFSRMPKWRGNVLATYHLTPKWDIGGNIQYASDSYGRLDNADEEDNVYGAQDGFLRLGVKTSYQLSDSTRLGFGVDNLSNETAYVAHPWPGRTLYMNFSYDY